MEEGVGSEVGVQRESEREREGEGWIDGLKRERRGRDQWGEGGMEIRSCSVSPR